MATVDSKSKSSGATRASLISRARHQQSEAWQELVDLYGPLVAHWCIRCGLDSHATADCMQDVFTSVAKSLDRFQSVKADGAFRGWLWTITLNKIRDHVRRDRKQTPGTGGSTALRKLNDHPERVCIPDEEPSEAMELQRLVARGLAQVRSEFQPRTWAIFQRAVIDQLPTDAVANEFAVTSAAVRQVRSRVLRRLRQQLGDLSD
jgi:RNA polymerase sigma-70 factor (ECF subfamily)